MKVYLNSIEIDKESLCVNSGLNYGRFFDNNTKEYEIRLNNSEVIDLIENEYNAVRDEIKADDSLFNDKSDFSNTNYCSLTELLKYEADFESIIKTYLDKNLFSKLFTETPNNKFVINSTESICVIKNEIVIKGKVFELGVSKK
jgi:hypothetical protein